MSMGTGFGFTHFSDGVEYDVHLYLRAKESSAGLGKSQMQSQGAGSIPPPLGNRRQIAVPPPVSDFQGPGERSGPGGL